MLSRPFSPPIHIELDDDQYLSDHPDFHQFPSGIIDKSDTNIGATHAELTSERHSILVFPSRSIAFNKYLQEKDLYFYVGSPFDGEPITNVEIQNYHLHPKIKHKKFLVVANSLHRVMDCIGIETAYQEYFFFFDEIDKFQAESTFRSELEECVDYFLDPRCNGCLISATVAAFTNPDLAKLPISIIKRKNPNKKDLNLYRIASNREMVLRLIYKRLEQYPNDKFLIAHKSTQQILYYANHLDINKRKDVEILCGDNSKEQVGEYFGNLINDKLPSRINFMTAAYFSGVDIKERYHLLIISDNSTDFTLLTMSEIRQIVGRCRKKTHLSISLVIPDTKLEFEQISKDELSETAETFCSKANEFKRTLEAIELDQDSLTDQREVITASKKHGTTLIRLGLNKQYQISTFTIDQYFNRQSELKKLYSIGGSTKGELSKYLHTKSPRKDFEQFDFENRQLKAFFKVASNPSIELPKPENKMESKVCRRIEICRDGLSSENYSWVIQTKYWNPIKFRKEYIIRYLKERYFIPEFWQLIAYSCPIRTAIPADSGQRSC